VATGQLVLPGQVAGLSNALRYPDTNNFGPRLGLAWEMNPKTVIRAGFGVSFYEDDNIGNQLYKNLPFYFNQAYSYSASGSPGLTIAQGLPLPVAPPLTDQVALSAGNPMAYDFHLKSEKILQYSFGIQRQLNSKIAMYRTSDLAALTSLRVSTTTRRFPELPRSRAAVLSASTTLTAWWATSATLPTSATPTTILCRRI
jgi:hypothetical protein